MARKSELLAPAGNYEAFLAAVENGADAVYLGGKLLNARQFAGNFENDELQKAIDYAHARGVKVLLTLNTLVLDDELQEALDYASTAYEMGVDAFIVQDLGLAAELKKLIPDIPLHGSTQMSIYSLEGVKVLEKMGFERVVLARELSLEEIKFICSNTTVEIEVFVHGALCISYSGQCLMSSMIGGRSGNRGKCAQPCRMHYSISRERISQDRISGDGSSGDRISGDGLSRDGLSGDRISWNGVSRANKSGDTWDYKSQESKVPSSSYLLSPKDICHIDHIGDLLAAGVTSLKIEGRMKSPEYVASVVGIYRKYLDQVEQQQAGPCTDATGDFKRTTAADNNKRTAAAGHTVLNPQVSKQDRQQLLQSFNRGGFSKGYLLGKTGPEMMAYEKPKNWGTYLGTALAQNTSTNSVKIKLENTLGNGDGIEIWSGKLQEESPGGIITKIVLDGGGQVKGAKPGDTVWVSVIKGRVEKGSRVYKTSDKEMLEQAAASYQKPTRRLKIKAGFMLKEGKLPELTLEDPDGNKVTVEAEVYPEKAVNKPLTEERVSEQLRKMGSTPFEVTELNVEMDAGIVMPISELNNLRRKVAELLENMRILKGRRKGQGVQHKLETSGSVARRANPAGEVKLSAMLYHVNEDLELGSINADRIYLPFHRIRDENLMKQIAELRKSGKEVYAYVPAVIKGRQSQLLNNAAQRINEIVDGFLVGNVGVGESLRTLLGQGVVLAGDYTLNLTNRASVLAVSELGYGDTALSYELNMRQLEEINKNIGLATEVGVYGRIPVMTSEYCPVGGSVSGAAPHKCKSVCKDGVYQLRDRKNAAFLVKTDCTDCRSTIFNADVLFVPDLINNLSKSGINYMRMSFVDESSREIYEIADLHRELMQGRRKTADSERIIDRIKSKGITKGHLHRGV